MDSRLLSGGRASGVRVFTVFVLSGSLFLLIYNVGRRRLNRPNSQSAMDTYNVGNPNSFRRYFSHHNKRPLTCNRKASLTLALDTSPVESSQRTTVPADSTSRAAALLASAADDFETLPVDSKPDRGRSAIDSSLLAGNYSRTSDFNLERSFSITEHEDHMMEHLRRSSRFENVQGSSTGGSLDFGRRRSSSRFLGDMSQLETLMGAMTTDTYYNSAISRVSVTTEPDRGDFGRGRSLSQQTGSTSPQEQFLKPLLHISIWFILSYSFDMFSSASLGAKKSKFPAPHLRTSVYFLMQSLISYCMLRWPANRVFLMPWGTFILRVFPVAAAAIVDPHVLDTSSCIGPVVRNSGFTELLSSFSSAPPTVWDIRNKSRGFVPLFVFFFGLVFRLEDRSTSDVVSIGIITTGFIYAVSKGTIPEVLSFMDSTVVPFVSGFRWAATQLLLQRRELGLMSPVVSMRALSPMMAMVTALLSYIKAEPWYSLHTTEFFDTPDHAFKSFCQIMIGALLATAVALAEFVVIYHTSALTLVVLHLLKDLLMVMIPRYFHGHDCSLQTICGVVAYSLGALCLTWLKYQRLLRRTRPQIRTNDAPSVASAPMIDKWHKIWTAWSTSLHHYGEPVGAFLHRVHHQGLRLSRKIIALWELAS